MDPVDEVSAENSDEGVKTLRGPTVVGRVIVRLYGQKHLGQIQLKRRKKIMRLKGFIFYTRGRDSPCSTVSFIFEQSFSFLRGLSKTRVVALKLVNLTLRFKVATH